MNTELPKSTGKRGSLRNIGIVVLVISLVWFVASRYILPPADFKGTGEKLTKIQITKGQTVSQIANVLKDAGVISSVDRFVSQCSADAKCNSLQPGTYQVKSKLPVRLALAALLDPANRVFTGLLIKEGLRDSEIIDLLARYTNRSPDEFQRALSNPRSLGLPKWANNNPEGFLFPATYEFSKSSTPKQALRVLVAKARAEYESVDLEQHAKKLGVSPQELLTMASILQAEAHPRDYSKVSRVILNRLATPMRLQLDSTVAYGLSKKQVILTDQDLKTDTKYNTYLHDGLPPGPINNPGVAAIVAAANPEAGNWLYFVTVNLDTGETKFTRSYDEFLRDKTEFLTYCRNNPGSC